MGVVREPERVDKIGYLANPTARVSRMTVT